MKKLTNTSFVFIIFSLFFLASPAMAGEKEELVLVEVSNNPINQNLTELKQQLGRKLLDSSQVSLVPAEKIRSYFDTEEVHPADMTEGDRLYTQAEDLLFNFQPAEADAMADKALEQLKQNPGVLGSLGKTYLFKARVALEDDRVDDANKAVKSAIESNMAMDHLDSYFYAPKMQRFYKRAYEQYMKEKNVLNVTLLVKGGKDDPIYVNGVQRGVGPSLEISVPSNTEQIFSAGGSPDAMPVHTLVVKEDKFNLASKKGRKNITESKFIGFKDEDKAIVAQQAIWLGKATEANQVVLLKLDEAGYLNRFTVSVVNVNEGELSKAKQIDLVDVQEDGPTAVSVAADFILNLSDADFSKTESSDNPLLVGRQKSKSLFAKPAFWTGVGVAVVGGTVGAILGMSGSDSSTTSAVKSTTTGVNIGGADPDNF